MKWVFTIPIFLFTINSIAFNEGLFLDYLIISDEKDSTLDPGIVKISGNVFIDDKPRPKALIATENQLAEVRSDSTGYFEFQVSLTDSILLYCYHPQAISEIIISNYNFKSQHAIVVDFYLRSSKQLRPMKKPVIYLYADENTTCSLDIIPNGELTFTYPEKKENWQIEVLKEGGLVVDDKTYPYLFWEAEGVLDYKFLDDKIEGQIIKTTELRAYFESSLNEFGLNAKESCDFITFWMPQLQSKEYVLIQWRIDDNYNETIAQLAIDPKPDNSRRIYLLASPLDHRNIKTVNQSLNSFERSGFTLVEWGGTIIPTNSKLRSL